MREREKETERERERERERDPEMTRMCARRNTRVHVGRREWAGDLQ